MSLFQKRVDLMIIRAFFSHPPFPLVKLNVDAHTISIVKRFEKLELKYFLRILDCILWVKLIAFVLGKVVLIKFIFSCFIS